MAADRPVMPPTSANAHPIQLTSGYHFIHPLPHIFAYVESNGQYTLIDKHWSLGALPLLMARKIYTIPHRGLKLAVTEDVLRSTPSDIRDALLEDTYAEDRAAYIRTTLTILGSAPEPVIRLILYYMQSGRFNSAKFNDGEYSFELSTAIIQQAILSNIPIVKQLALTEMHREFFGRSMGLAVPKKLADLTQAQITRLAAVGNDEYLWQALFFWALRIYQHPPGQRTQSKQAIEATLQEKGKRGKTALNKAWPKHLRDVERVHGEDGEVFKTGEVERFREMVRINAPRDDRVGSAIQEDNKELTVMNESDSDISTLLS